MGELVWGPTCFRAHALLNWIVGLKLVPVLFPFGSTIFTLERSTSDFLGNTNYWSHESVAEKPTSTTDPVPYFFWRGTISLPIPPILLLPDWDSIVLFFFLLFFYCFDPFLDVVEKHDVESVVEDGATLARDYKALFYIPPLCIRWECCKKASNCRDFSKLHFQGIESTEFISLHSWVTPKELLNPLDGCRLRRTCMGLISFGLLTPLLNV